MLISGTNQPNYLLLHCWPIWDPPRRKKTACGKGGVELRASACVEADMDKHGRLLLTKKRPDTQHALSLFVVHNMRSMDYGMGKHSR